MPIDLSDLHPDLVAKVLSLQSAAFKEGITFAKTSGRRTFQMQALFYTTYLRSPQEAREKYGVVAKPAPMGLSRHHGYFQGKAGAVDLGVTNATSPDDKKAKQKRLVILAREQDLICGEDWGDPVHFEIAVGGKRMDTDAQYVKLAEKLDRIDGNIITRTPPLPGGGA